MGFCEKPSGIVMPEALKPYYSSCVTWPDEDLDLLEGLIDGADDIDLEKFESLVGTKDMRHLKKHLGYRAEGIQLHEDYHVRYHLHAPTGIPFMVHSATEHVFATQDDLNRLRAHLDMDDEPVPVEERGDWQALASGQMWSLDAPHANDVNIVDIACGLARQCRYAGQIDPDFDFYAVTEHSVLMTQYAIDNGLVDTQEDALAILLHDGSESLMGDMITPRKRKLPTFIAMEDQAQAAIMGGFGLHAGNTLISKAEIKVLDVRIRVDEREKLILDPARANGLPIEWEGEDMTPLGVEIQGLNPRQSRELFLDTFNWVVECLPRRVETNPRLDHQIELLDNFQNRHAPQDALSA
jgi:hypothetical protein